MDGTSTDTTVGKRRWTPFVVSGLVAIVATAAGTTIAARLTSREPELLYSVVESLPFAAPDNVVGVYQVTISNEGKREVDEVTGAFRIPDATLEKFKVVAPGSMRYDAKVEGDLLHVGVPLMNPGDVLTVSILASAKAPLPSRPDVSVRSRGLNGKEKADRPGSKNALSFWLALAGAASGVLGAGSSFSIFRKATASPGILAIVAACRAHGLEALAAEFELSDPTYYIAGDRIADFALHAENRTVLDHCRSALLTLSQSERIAIRSRASLLVHAARLALKAGADVEAQVFLAQARSLSASDVEAKLKVFPMEAPDLETN